MLIGNGELNNIKGDKFMTIEIKEIIQRCEINGDFTYTVLNDGKKELAEKELGLKIPEQYLDFLNLYGHGGINGFEVFGVGKNGDLIFVEETLNLRQYNLPYEFIAIEDCDEWVYCISSNTGEIFSWSSEQIILAYDCFDDYFLDRLKDAEENL